MYLTILVIFLVYLVGIKSDYAIDKGFNVKAKIINPIITVIIFGFYLANLSDKISWVYYNADHMWTTLYVKIGIITPLFSLLSWILYLVTCGVLVALCWTLIFRKESSRILFLRVIPFVWGIESIEIYKMSMEDNANLTNNEVIGIVLMLFTSVMWFLIYKLYSSNFFVKFYLRESSEMNDFYLKK